MNDSVLTAYDALARFYGPLVRQSGRVETEIALLCMLLRRAGVPQSARILDAACGTGDVLAGLRRHGYTRSVGLDGSPGMVAYAREILTPTDVTVCDWSSLSDYFKSNGTFDVVFLLSMSLPHAMQEDLPTIIESIQNGLNPNGLLFFDTRDWHLEPDGTLKEWNRPATVYRWLEPVTIADKLYWIDDQCFYDANRQHVIYRIGDCESSSDTTIEKVELSYAAVPLDQWRHWLRESGFEEIEAMQPRDWPYIVLRARSSPDRRTTNSNVTMTDNYQLSVNSDTWGNLKLSILPGSRFHIFEPRVWG